MRREYVSLLSFNVVVFGIALAIAFAAPQGAFAQASSGSLMPGEAPTTESTSAIGESPGGATLSTESVQDLPADGAGGTADTPPKDEPKAPESGEKKSSAGLGLLSLFQKGGPVMWPLFAALLIAFAFTIERGIVFGKARMNVRAFMRKIDDSLEKGDTKGAIGLCEQARGPVASVIKAGLLRWDKGKKQVEKAIETAGAGAMSKMERGLPVLASIANIAPLLGFLGTVTGMIKSFGVIAKAGLSNPGLVAQGISEALITTASGLIIAIPALAAFNFFTSMIAKSALEMDESTSQLLDRAK